MENYRSELSRGSCPRRTDQQLSRKSQGAKSEQLIGHDDETISLNIESPTKGLRALVKQMAENVLECQVSARFESDQVFKYYFLIPLDIINKKKQLVLQIQQENDNEESSMFKSQQLRSRFHNRSTIKHERFVYQLKNSFIKTCYEIRLRLMDQLQKLGTFTEINSLKLEQLQGLVYKVNTAIKQSRTAEIATSLQEKWLSQIQFQESEQSYYQREGWEVCTSEKDLSKKHASLDNLSVNLPKSSPISSGHSPNKRVTFCEKCRAVKLENEIMFAENNELQQRIKDMKAELDKWKLMQINLGEFGSSIVTFQKGFDYENWISSKQQDNEGQLKVQNSHTVLTTFQLRKLIKSKTWVGENRQNGRLFQSNNEQLNQGSKRSPYQTILPYQQLETQQYALNEQLRLNNLLIEEGFRSASISLSQPQDFESRIKDIKNRIDEIPAIREHLQSLTDLQDALDTKIKRMSHEISELESHLATSQANILQLTVTNHKLVTDQGLQNLKLSELQDELNAWRAHGIANIGRKSQHQKLMQIIQCQSVNLMQYQDALQQQTEQQQWKDAEIEKLRSQLAVFQGSQATQQNLNAKLEWQENVISILRSLNEKQMNIWIDLYNQNLAKDLQSQLLKAVAQNNNERFATLSQISINNEELGKDDQQKENLFPVLATCESEIKNLQIATRKRLSLEDHTLIYSLIHKAALLGRRIQSDIHYLKHCSQFRMATLLNNFDQHMKSCPLARPDHKSEKRQSFYEGPQDSSVYVSGLEQAMQQTMQAYAIQREINDKLSHEKQTLLLLLQEQFRIRQQLIMQSQASPYDLNFNEITNSVQINEFFERGLISLLDQESKLQHLQEFCDSVMQKAEQLEAERQISRWQINDLNKQLFNQSLANQRYEQLQRQVSEASKEALKWRNLYLQLAELQNNMEGQLPDVKALISKLQESLSTESIAHTQKIQESQTKIFDLESQILKLTSLLQERNQLPDSTPINFRGSPLLDVFPEIPPSKSTHILRPDDVPAPVRQERNSESIVSRSKAFLFRGRTDIFESLGQTAGPQRRFWRSSTVSISEGFDSKPLLIRRPERLFPLRSIMSAQRPLHKSKRGQVAQTALSPQPERQRRKYHSLEDLATLHGQIQEHRISSNTDLWDLFLKVDPPQEVEQIKVETAIQSPLTKTDESLETDKQMIEPFMQQPINSNPNEKSDFQLMFAKAQQLLAEQDEQLKKDLPLVPQPTAPLAETQNINLQVSPQPSGLFDRIREDTIQSSNFQSVFNPKRPQPNYALSLAAMARPTFIGVAASSPDASLLGIKSLRQAQNDFNKDQESDSIVIDRYSWQPFLWAMIRITKDSAMSCTEKVDIVKSPDETIKQATIELEKHMTCQNKYYDQLHISNQTKFPAATMTLTRRSIDDIKDKSSCHPYSRSKSLGGFTTQTSCHNTEANIYSIHSQFNIDKDDPLCTIHSFDVKKSVQKTNVDDMYAIDEQTSEAVTNIETDSLRSSLDVPKCEQRIEKTQSFMEQIMSSQRNQISLTRPLLTSPDLLPLTNAIFEESQNESRPILLTQSYSPLKPVQLTKGKDYNGDSQTMEFYAKHERSTITNQSLQPDRKYLQSDIRPSNWPTMDHQVKSAIKEAPRSSKKYGKPTIQIKNNFKLVSQDIQPSFQLPNRKNCPSSPPIPHTSSQPIVGQRNASYCERKEQHSKQEISTKVNDKFLHCNETKDLLLKIRTLRSSLCQEGQQRLLVNDHCDHLEEQIDELSLWCSELKDHYSKQLEQQQPMTPNITSDAVWPKETNKHTHRQGLDTNPRGRAGVQTNTRFNIKNPSFQTMTRINSQGKMGQIPSKESNSSQHSSMQQRGQRMSPFLGQYQSRTQQQSDRIRYGYTQHQRVLNEPIHTGQVRTDALRQQISEQAALNN